MNLNETMKTFALSGIQQRHPEAIPAQLQRMLGKCCLDRILPKRRMTMQGDAICMTLRVTDALEKMRIPYAVAGPIAGSVHGVMRSTMDVDIVAHPYGCRLEAIHEGTNIYVAFRHGGHGTTDDSSIRS